MNIENSTKLKLLITGANGFIGTNFLNKFHNNYDIVALTHNNNSLKITFDTKNITIDSHDIINNSIIEKIVSYNPDVILHLANFGYLRDCENNPDNAHQTNIVGLSNIIKACEKINSKIIFTSSREVYGETIDQKSSETDILSPNNVLGKTKVLSEILIKSSAITSGFDYTIIRPSNIFGPFSPSSVVGLMLNSALKERKISVYGGEQTLNLVYIDYVIDIIDKIIQNPKLTKNTILNVGSSENITVIELAKRLASLFDNKINILKLSPRDSETKYFKPNLDKIQKIFSYNPKKTLSEELKETFDWFKKYITDA
jgi:UDP-glucose 4-epimerase